MRTLPNRLLLAACLLVSASAARAADKVTFDRAFAPSEGLTVEGEKPARDEMCLNGSWQFQPVPLPADFRQNVGKPPSLPEADPGKWESTPIRIPSPWNVNAFPYGPSAPDRLGPGGDFRAFPSYPAAWDKAEMGWLRKTFAVPAQWKGKRLILHFEAVAGQTQVIVNGRKVGENFELFLPFDVDVTDAVREGGENELLVGVRRAELFCNNGPMGKRSFVAGSMWGESIVGIWQDVFLQAVSPVRVADTLVQSLVDADALQADLTLRNDTKEEQKVEVGGTVQPWVNLAGAETLSAPEPKWKLDPAVMEIAPQSVTIPAGGTVKVSLKDAVKGKLKTWSPDAPNLYGLTVTVSQNGQAIDKKYTRFGYRQFKLGASHLELNGKEITMKGDAWHFLGVPEMTRRYAWAWYTALKAANANAVRLHAQPYPRLFLDMADEMGILVLDETGIWGSGGTPKFDDPKYWAAADEHLHRMVERDKNHAGVLGYSVTNEVLVIMRNRRASKEVMDMAFGHYSKWVDDIRKMDPTHPWISGDGEEGADMLPTLIGHYGGSDGPKRWSKFGKPWGVGECGMAYYGTPKQVSEYNGQAAYESMEERLKGCAIQAYELITQTHIANNAAYSSVFNIVWYGLQPLELGLRDTSRAPRVSDGVWFGKFAEGQPGMQPERIGPYCTTLNPGYDPSLPLYKTWPMFDAIKAANTVGGPAKSEWDHRVTSAATGSAAPAKVGAVEFISSGKTAAKLDLQLMGVPLADDASGPNSLVVIDGSAPPKAGAKSKVDAVLSAGGTVLVWHPKESALDALNALLPEKLELTGRNSSTLVRRGDDPIIAGVNNSDLYFTELKPDVIVDSGLAGPLVEKGKVLLAAPAADWRLWNNRPEVIKTASVTRSEREAQAGGAALVVTPVGKGRIVVANLSGITATPERVETARKLLANLGVQLAKPRDLISGGVFTNGGVLRRALFLGRFPDQEAEAMRSAAHAELADGPAFDAPAPGQAVGNAKWTEGTIEPNTQLFDLGSGRMKLAGSNHNAVAYVSFWINSPRGLDDVLGQPDVPRVDLLINGGERTAGAWLNGKLLKDDANAAATAKSRQAFPALVLKRGWNHVVVKLFRNDGKWEFGAELRCSDPDYLSTTEAALTPPH